MASRVIRNTALLALGETVGRLLRIVLIFYAARVLGAAEWGLSSYLLSWAVLVTIATDLGLGAIVTRELVRDGERRAHYLSSFLYAKIGLLAIGSLAIILIVPRISALPISSALAFTLVALVFFDSLRIIPSAMNRAEERMGREAGVNIVTQAIILGLGILILKSNASALGLNIAYALGSAFGTLYAFTLVRKHLTGIFTSFKVSVMKELMKDALPVAVVGLLGSIMLNTDIIMLGWMRSAEEIGYYSAAQKIIFTLYVLPALVASALFPTMTRIAHDTKAFKELIEKSLKGVLLVALPLVAGGIVTAGGLIQLFYGVEYLPATAPFIILLISIPSVYMIAIVNNALIAKNEQKYFVRYAVAGVFANAGLNFALIPTFGIAGVAFATLVTETGSVLYICHKAHRLTGASVIPRGLGACIIATTASTIVAVGAMATHLHVLVAISLAILVYLGMLVLLREETLNGLTKMAK